MNQQQKQDQYHQPMHINVLKIMQFFKQAHQIIQLQQYQKCMQMIDEQITIITKQQILVQINTKNYNEIKEQIQKSVSEDKSIEKMKQPAKDIQNLMIQLLALKGYVFMLMKKYKQALNNNAFHLPSKKRRALALQKLGEYQQSFAQFQNCLYLQPQSKSLKNKIKRLCKNTSSAKSQSASSEGVNTFQSKQKCFSNKNNKQIQFDTSQSTTKNQQQNNSIKQKSKTQSVKFGTFQVFQTTGIQESDQHFAIIKQQIKKLSQKKPKKSILKQSTPGIYFKQKNKQKQLSPNFEKQTQNYSENKQQINKAQNEQDKSQNNQNFNTYIQKQLVSVPDKLKIKKKSKSVTFKGDTNLQDFN